MTFQIPLFLSPVVVYPYFHPIRGHTQVTFGIELFRSPLVLYPYFQLEIRAYDLGEPVLDSNLKLMVIVKQVVTQPPESGMGFTELHHRDVTILENSISGTLIKTLEIGQKVDREINIKCDVIEVVNSRGEKIRTPGTPNKKTC